MTLDEYQKLAARTAAMPVPRPVQRFTFTVGLVCEATEVADVVWRGWKVQEGATKELGDVLWYAAALCTEYDLSMPTIMGATFEEIDSRPRGRDIMILTRRLVKAAGDAADYLKKVIGHGHELDKSTLASYLKTVIWAVAALCRCLEIPMAQVAEANIEKLRARYPDGFSSEHSINRVEGPPTVGKPGAKT